MLIEAAGDSPSEAVQAILDEYTAMIENATSISEVESLADEGLAAINSQLESEGPSDLDKVGSFIRKFFDFIARIISYIRSLFSFS